MADRSAGKSRSVAPGKHPMDVFRDAVKKILSVPKEEIDRRIKAERKHKK